MKLNRDEMKNIKGGLFGNGKCTATCKVNSTNTVLGSVDVPSCGGTELSTCQQAYPDSTVAVCTCTGTD